MFPIVYYTIVLALLLPVVTTTFERAFLANKIIKTEWLNKMCDGWLNYLVLFYTEQGIFEVLDLDEINK
jgi:hypothetical protein